MNIQPGRKVMGRKVMIRNSRCYTKCAGLSSLLVDESDWSTRKNRNESLLNILLLTTPEEGFNVFLQSLAAKFRHVLRFLLNNERSKVIYLKAKVDKLRGQKHSLRTEKRILLDQYEEISGTLVDKKSQIVDLTAELDNCRKIIEAYQGSTTARRPVCTFKSHVRDIRRLKEQLEKSGTEELHKITNDKFKEGVIHHESAVLVIHHEIVALGILHDRVVFVVLHESVVLVVLHESVVLGILHDSVVFVVLHESVVLVVLHESVVLGILHDSVVLVVLHDSVVLVVLHDKPRRPEITHSER
ncbi:hypothetical protein Btru_073725 [Bulinus truncatus]|nr:hypothetical protein Btru_073725 [Bulinus truncatus]